MANGEASNVPKDLHNLDEIAAPPPAETQEAKKKRLWLGYSADNIRSKKSDPKSLRGQQETGKPGLSADAQQTYNAPNHYDNLDELADPSPVDPEQARTRETLEDRSDGSPGKETVQDSPSQRQRVSRLVTELYTISYLILFSILGTLARLGLQALTFYPGAPVQTGLLWANIGGSLILGFLSEDRKLFQEEWGNKKETPEKNGDPQKTSSANKNHSAVKKTIPLYIGLAVGFCGSFTSFSSFMRDTFYALANALPVPINHPSSAPISETENVHRNPGYSFLAVLAELIITVGLSLSALQLGAHLALGLEPYTPSIPFLFARKIVDRTITFLAWGCWLGAVLMAIFPPDRPGGPVGHDTSFSQETWRSKALFALVFAPLGCLLRFYASLHLNGRVKSFPLGTFAVNFLGTALQAMFIDLQRAPLGGMVGCQVLQGLQDGFCGCLTTVSTWVSELRGLRIRHAYFYGGMSIGVSLSFMIIIMGSLLWTRGFVDPLCTT